jgi:hypothetical protein
MTNKTEPKRRKRELPEIQVFALCDQVIQDARTGKWTLVGLFEGVAALAFPTIMQGFLFMSVIGGRGVVPMDFFLVQLDTGLRESIGKAQFTVNDPLAPAQICTPIAMRFDRAGVYALEVSVNGEPFTSRRIQAALLCRQ